MPSEVPGTAQAPATPEVRSRLTQEQANDVTLYAISLVGTPYRWGGNTPESGFDCSGLIGHVYKTRAGVAAPRTVAALIDWGQPVPNPSLRTGDLVVFTQKGVTNHAGIYVGEGRFVHAPSSGGVVRLDALNSKYWMKQGVSYRRP
jgi:cell wall-associated NlpC family hydrolase